MIGRTLCHFKITDKLGEGGMGEVYRAEDSKLGREVALKVLPEAFAADADRMARFAREAQVLASLNHPHIAGIYQVEHDEGVHFLVMELVEGETLSERIARGPLPTEEALQLALQLAFALEEAHDRGIVHRDLKPANIKITPQGQVKALDFGLAKALEDDPAGPGSQPALAHSPTLTAQMTGAGVLLGTAAYMSPEQARGNPADRRSDIWAFGVVLTEMLTGKTVYAGQTVSDTLAGVLAREPEWDALPEDTPRSVRRLLERCLEKELRNRLQAIGEARIAIENYLADPAAAEAEAEVAPSLEVARTSTLRSAVPWVLAGLLGLGLIGSMFVLRNDVAPAESLQPLRMSVGLPEQKSIFRGYGSSAVLSPDGRKIAYVFSRGVHYEIYLHSLDQWEGAPLMSEAGEGRPYQPFFSPDGEWLGFVTPTELKKLPISGGTPITLAKVNLARGASWGTNDTIVFAPNPRSGLHTLSSAGGESKPLTELDEQKGEATHRWPQVLPGGKGVIFTSHAASSKFYEASIEVVVLETGERKVLHRGGTFGRYVDSGQLVYVHSGTIFAIPFDLETLEVTGSAAPVIEGVAASSSEGSAQFSVSPDGKLAYVSGTGTAPTVAPVWVDRHGNATKLWDEHQVYGNPRFAPDGKRLAVEVYKDDSADIWVYDVARDVPTRLTFDEAEDANPVWTPDGEKIVFGSERDGVSNIYLKAADGSGGATRLTESDLEQYPWSISPDGKTLVYGQRSEGTLWDIWLMPLDGDGEPAEFLATSFLEFGPVFSPDGRWIAYFSNESDAWEVYVRPASGVGKWQISSGGGTFPIWSPDGKELYFWVGGGVSRVEIDGRGDSLRAGRPELMFEGKYADLGVSISYDVAPDGKRFLMFEDQDGSSAQQHQHVNFVLNWFPELERTFGKDR
jgi:Tol biopolymer transport system component